MMKSILYSTLVTASLAIAGHASATFIVEPSPAEGCAPSQGCLHLTMAKDASSSTGTVQSTTDVVDIAVVGNSDFANGYSTIKPITGGTLTSLTFTPVDDTNFSDFSFRGQVLNASDAIDVTVTDQSGTPFSFSFTVPTANADFSRLGVISMDGETIKSVAVTDSGGFKEFKQIDFSPAVVPVIPEPATWALMLIGLGATGSILRRRAHRPAATT